MGSGVLKVFSTNTNYHELLRHEDRLTVEKSSTALPEIKGSIAEFTFVNYGN
jgi:hypothetical protein